MPKLRRCHSAEFKFKVALEAVKEQKTVNEIASAFSLHPNQVSTWKHALLEAGDNVLRQPASQQQREHVAPKAKLYEQIGRLKMELEWLEKKSAGLVSMKRTLLRGVTIVQPDQVWSADITYIPMGRVSCISWRFWTGSVATSSRGSFRIR